MIYISNIQHFSVGDGEGIRTTVFFKGCNLRCPWCHNPENLCKEVSILKYPNQQKTEVCGYQTSAQAILPELLEDKNYYLASGGGVTLSGGEVMLKARGAAELANLLKNHDISVLIDTAGCVPYQFFKEINPFVKGYLFDFKTASEEKYKEIGGDLNLVTGNIKQLLQENRWIRIRIPLIPHFNIEEPSIQQICSHLKTLHVKEVDLLPFHRLGSAKYAAKGLCYAYKDVLPIEKDKLEKIQQYYSKYFKINIES